MSDLQEFNRTDLFSIEGKVALVTGGSRGIGLMIAKAYVANGAKVYISSRKAEVCEAVAAELSKYGECIALPADLADDNGRKDFVNALATAESQLHILVNNAGAAWGAPLSEYPEAGYDKVMDINVRTPFFLTRDLLPLLEAAGTAEDPARIINIGSIDGLHVSHVDNFSYGPSKAAIHHMTKVFAVELGPKHMTVNAIAPGPFVSKMTEWLLDEHGENIKRRNPLGRIGSETDMGGLALFLASKAGAYMNGTIIPLDGGMHYR